MSQYNTVDDRLGRIERGDELTRKRCFNPSRFASQGIERVRESNPRGLRRFH